MCDRDVNNPLQCRILHLLCSQCVCVGQRPASGCKVNSDCLYTSRRYVHFKVRSTFSDLYYTIF